MEKFEYDKYVVLRDMYKNKVNSVASVRMIVFILMVISFIVGSSYNFFNIIGIILIILFIVLIFIHDKYYKLMDYYDKYVMIIEEYRDRTNGKWKSFADKGEEFKNELFDDLDIVGDNSLFQFISVCKSLGGRKKLIDKLSNKDVGIDKIKDNQEVVKEVCNKVDFVVDFQVNMLQYNNKNIDFKSSFKYLDKRVGKRKIDFIIGIILSVLVFVMLGLGVLKVISINYFYGMFMFNFLANFMYSYIYREEFNVIDRVSDDYSKLKRIYSSVLKVNFKSKVMKDICSNINKSSVSIDKLVKINDLNSLKNNILSSFIFNGLFSINIMVMYRYAKFLDNNIYSIKEGVSDIEELEAIISLAGIGIVKKNICMPVIGEDIKLEFNNIKHPLLDENVCVGNDFGCNRGVNIITGSNMGGKTSFLRMIGINLILMNAGSYVVADSFSSCYLKIFTSLNVSDDIDKGISTFYGELLRIKKALEYNLGNRIVLVDEIFKGTNYQDRIYGAVNVIKKLNDNRTIMFVTTHDFELCDIKDKCINNYYFKEYYEGDNIKFDYKIRSGKCESTNAKYLMKKLNIID